jgi:hypothetical protein
MAVILRELSLDVIADPSAERAQYWGPVGHFKIGQQACFLVKNVALRNFLTANIDNLSFSTDQQIETATHLQATNFVPLSDVPDVVWKTTINRSKPSVARPMENWNHYSDIDMPGADGKTLMALYQSDENTLNYSNWLNFYKSAPVPSESTSISNAKGALPFRVWQIFAKLSGFAKQGEGARFLTAAGCLAHYIGDACQPLHSSQHSDGLNGASTGVHSTYEDNMVDAHADDIAAGFSKAVSSLTFQPRSVKNPRDAAKAVMDLMIFAHKTLPPETICRTYNQARPDGHTSATKDKTVLDALWNACGEQTIEVIAAGAATLAAIWQAAWDLSGASAQAAWLKKKFNGTKDLMPVYEDLSFLRSIHLNYMGQGDLPGSDAPKNPPPLPSGAGAAGQNDERGHSPNQSHSAPRKTPTTRNPPKAVDNRQEVSPKLTSRKKT